MCSSTSNFRLKDYRVDDLASAWKGVFGFDPFPPGSESTVITKVRCTVCEICFYTPSIAGDKSFYSKLSKFPWYYESQKWEFDMAMEYISEYKPSSLLEIGCGSGQFLDKVRNAIPESEGVDINEDAIALCKAKGLKVWSGELFESGKRYEMIVLFQVLEHLENVASILDKIIGMLAPGGMLLIAVPNPDSYLKESELELGDMPPHHALNMNRKSLEYIGSSRSLEMIKYAQEPLRYRHYLVYLNTLVNQHFGTMKPSMKARLQSKIQRKATMFLAPFRFVQDKAAICGQTHLALYRKGGESDNARLA